MFYNKLIKIYANNEGVTNDAGIYHETDKTYIKDLMVDLQPYSSDLLYKNYGYNVECSKRMFCPVDALIVCGNSITYNNKLFNIVKVIEWDNYLEVMLNDL